MSVCSNCDFKYGICHINTADQSKERKFNAQTIISKVLADP